MEKLYHKGVMKTKCDDCQFVCITQESYYRLVLRKIGRELLMTNLCPAGFSIRVKKISGGTKRKVN
jgi:hypothetical protein